MPADLIDPPIDPAKHSSHTLRNSRARAADPGRTSDGPGVVVMVGDDKLRDRFLKALAGSDVSCDVIRCVPSGKARGNNPLLVVDAEGLASTRGRRYRGAVAVLCDGPAPAERVRLVAAGVEHVLDAAWPAEDLARVVAYSAGAQRQGTAQPSFAHFVSSAPVMQELLATARLLVDAPSPVLLTGETGVGKEHLARAIHAEGPRAKSPFLLVNCGALPESLLESQLFGHVRGAFTGADRTRQGFFEAAKDGTLLLDEIGEMPQHLQVKLLNVLERREVVPVGGCNPTPIHARIMAATNRDLGELVERDEFRADLFYRLNVVHLEVPPLRNRRQDIADLLGSALFDLWDTSGPGYAQAVTDIDDEALEALLAYPWPGNVRELRNVVERALVLGRERREGLDPQEGSRVELDDLPTEVRTGQGLTMPGNGAPPATKAFDKGRSLKEAREAAVAEAERVYLEAALRATQGRIAQTAKRAGIGTRSLYDKMKRYDLRKEDFRPQR